MATSIGLTASPSAAVFPRSWAVVEIKQGWKEKWVATPNLVVEQITVAAAPEISHCDLAWRVGRLKYPTTSTFSQFDPLALNNWYVRVRIYSAEKNFQPVSSFTGVLDEDVRILQPANWPKGRQSLRAYGLPHLMDRNGLDNAFVRQADETIEIGWTPTFNASTRRGMSIRGNRHPEMDADLGHYVFGRGAASESLPGDDELWTNRDIAEYLLTSHPQAALLSEIGINMELDGEAAKALEAIVEVHDFAGKTLWQCLNELITPRRGLAFYIEISEEKKTFGRVYLRVVSISGADLKSGKKKLKRNTQNVSFTMPASWPNTHLVGQVPITRSSASSYDTIIARGARVKVCGSWSYRHDTLTRDWSTSRAGEYLAAGGNDDPREADAYRAAERFASVFVAHCSPERWDWELGRARNGDAKSNDPRVNVAPYVREDGEVFFADEEYGPGPGTDFDKEFVRDLPFLEGVDYSTSEPEFPGRGRERRFRPMLAFVKDTADGGLHDASQKWRIVDRLRESDEDLQSCNISPLDSWIGVVLGSTPRHYWANNADWVEDTPTEVEPELSYRQLLVTGMVETDSHISVEWRRPKKKKKKKKGKPDGREFERKLIIDVPDCEFWYVAPGTVVDVDADGKLVHVHRSHHYIRDDTPKLHAAAAFAAAWYGVDRYTVRIPIHRVGHFVSLGAYLTEVRAVRDTQPIGTIVTARRIDFRNRVTVIETGFAALDAAGLAAATAPVAARKQARYRRAK